jgi:hypothetical protein
LIAAALQVIATHRGEAMVSTDASVVTPTSRSETSTPLNTPDIAMYWANRKRHASKSPENLHAVNDAIVPPMPNKDKPDGDCDIDTSENEVVDGPKDQGTSNSGYATPLATPTEIKSEPTEVGVVVDGDGSKDQGIKLESAASPVGDLTSKPEYDGTGWGPDEDDSESGSVIHHPVPKIEDEVATGAATSAEKKRSSQATGGTDVIDFAYAKEDGDDRSTTSSMTEVNITGTDKVLESAEKVRQS